MRTLEARLRRELDGDVLFDAASRGRYATDASIYQIEPVGVVIPRTEEAARLAIAIASDAGVPILPRGAGSSQCGQAVGAALVIDDSRYLNRLLDFDAAAKSAVVQPGIVLDSLNAMLRPHGLWFPVDVSTSAQATLGGMAGNNSCGSRSIAYGNMVHNVHAIDAATSDGRQLRFGPLREDSALDRQLRGLYAREKDEIAARFPKVLRRVAGYNLDHLGPPHENSAHVLVGSEGTLAYFERLHLRLSPLPAARALGVCHFPRFHTAMALTQHIVTLGPSAVELVDRTMIGLAREIPAFRKTVDAVIHGNPDAILLVEFAGDDAGAQQAKLRALAEMMDDLGVPRCVVDVTDPTLQKNVWEVRKAGLNIMMSMKGDGKPVSFIEDCAVPLEHLADYTQRLTQVFEKHGTHGTWYAHASVGTLHVRPILDMRRDGAQKMRAIAEEACALVKEYKGAYSGEHGDGLVRSEWIEPFFGPRLTACLAEIKSWLDPRGLMNPGKIVRPPRMDDASLFRFKPGYAARVPLTVLDWREWEAGSAERGSGFAKAVEMCNNNGHCRKFDAGTMCPSFRVTGEEKHLTRGRANTLRLALSGQLGEQAFSSGIVKDALDLCVSCKGCKRECPTGVDMARMKLEATAHYKSRHGYGLRDRLIGYLPRYAPWAAPLAPIINLLGRLPLREALTGFASRRALPAWRRDAFVDRPRTMTGEREVVLFVDTFNRYFEPENVRAALRVLAEAGYRAHVAQPIEEQRPLCCGRTFLAAGMPAQAKVEAQRTLDALKRFVDLKIPVLGLEPSCIFSFRDELPVLLPGEETAALARSTLLFEEFVAREADAGRFRAPLGPLGRPVRLHGHCHQKAFGAMGAVEQSLRLIPQIDLQTVESGCCGMAGSFGYEAEHYDISMRMAELDLLPALRQSPASALIAADGISCRHQIADGAGRGALHVARILELALPQNAA